MQHNPAAWQRLAEIGQQYGVQIACLQEASAPRSQGWLAHPAAAVPESWVIQAHADMRLSFASAVVAVDPEVARLTPIEPLPLAQAPAGAFAASHPGQF